MKRVRVKLHVNEVLKMSVYLTASKLKEIQQMIPDDKNILDKDDFIPDLLNCINSSNINEKDKISIKYYFESLCSLLKVKYLKMIGEKSLENNKNIV